MRFLKNLFYLLISDAASKIINFFVLAYLARTLLPEGLGLVNWVQSILLIVAVIPNFGLSEFGILSIAKDRERPTVEATVNSILGFRILFSGLIITALILVVSFASELKGTSAYFIAGSIYLVASSIAFDWFYTSIENQAVPGIFRIVSKSVYLLGTLIFVHSDKDILAVILIFSISELLFSAGLLSYYRYRLNYRITPAFTSIRETFVKAYPLALYTANSVIVSSVDIVIMGMFLSMEQIGLYSGVLKIVTLFMSIKYLLGQLIYPKLVKGISGKKDDLRNVLLIINKYAIVGGIVLVSFLFIFSDILITIVLGGAYRPAIPLFRILLISLFAEFGWIVYPYLVISHNKNVYSIIMIAMGIGKVLLIFAALQFGGAFECAVMYSSVSVVLFAVCVGYIHRNALAQNISTVFIVPILAVTAIIASGYFPGDTEQYAPIAVPFVILSGIVILKGKNFSFNTIKSDIKFINAV